MKLSCKVRYSVWEAFSKYGYDGGDGPLKLEASGVVKVELIGLGYDYGTCGTATHNCYISRLTKGDKSIDLNGNPDHAKEKIKEVFPDIYRTLCESDKKAVEILPDGESVYHGGWPEKEKGVGR